MNKKIIPMIVAASFFTAGSAFAAAVTQTTTTWTDEQGNVIRQYSTTKKYEPVTNPQIDATVGVELPQNVTLYDLPDTIKIQEPDRYRYVIVNNHPVVVERSNRRIVHVW